MIAESLMAAHEKNQDILIVGGGIIGLSTAWELTRRGCSVGIIDAGLIGRGKEGASSWAGAGILPPAANRNRTDPFEDLQHLSLQLHHEWARELRATTGIDTGFRQCGGIYLARSMGETATLTANQIWWTEHGIDFEVLSGEQIREMEPKLSPNLEASTKGWHLPGECTLRNPDQLSALRAACEQAGVTFAEHSPVRQIQSRDGRVQSLQLRDGSKITANRYVICSGAWSRQFLEQFGLTSGLMPIRGQIILYRFEEAPLQRIVNEGHRYLVPRRDGHILAGSVEEEVGFEVGTTEEALGQIRSWAHSILPQLSSAPEIKRWSGLRPGSYDTLPYIGSVPNLENLFLAAGHFRSGIYLSCGTAVCLADLLENKNPPVELDPFRIARG
ncbi:MAG: glycine oxidase ThiO [Aureliella sp.]